MSHLVIYSLKGQQEADFITFIREISRFALDVSYSQRVILEFFMSRQSWKRVIDFAAKLKFMLFRVLLQKDFFDDKIRYVTN